MEDCLFCGIGSGDVSAKKVYEDEIVVAFDDIAPQSPVHTLIIPKEHYKHLGDGVPAETLQSLFSAVPEVARIKGVDETGYRVIVNNGADANQTVGHLHVHVMGGRAMSHGMVSFSE